MLFAAKVKVISDQVINCGKDTKALYVLISNITGVRKENPLPIHTNDKELADQFADFFLEKIVKIRDELKDKNLYVPYDQVNVNMDTLTPVSEDYIRKTIMTML